MTSKYGLIASAALRCGVAACALGLAGPAFAQGADSSAPAAQTGDKGANDIVVTGTLIRGKAPTGGEMVSVTSQDIAKLGISDTSQILSALPQDAEFNNRPQVGGYGQYQSVNAPLLRNLGGGSSGSNSTLLLVDGVRMPGMGIQQTSADIDAISPGALQRVDAAADGGSAIYGSDAVGGVVNLITRNRFDGLEVGGHYGGASDYHQWDVSATAGKSWSNGSAWISYEYTQHNMIYNSSRDYIHFLNYAANPVTGNSTGCSPGNFVQGGYVATTTPPYYALVTKTYPIVNGVPATGAPNTCDNSGTHTFFPGERRHSVMAGLDVDLADWLTFNVKAYYMHRHAFNDAGLDEYTGVPANYCTYGPAYICSTYHLSTAGTASGVFNDPFGQHQYSSTNLSTWAVIPRLIAKLGGGWQMNTFLNAGEGIDKFQGPYQGGDPNALAAEVASGAFNPFTGLFASSTAGQAALNYQQNYDAYSSGKDDIINARSVFEGPLFALPGGTMRAALGAETFHEDFTQRNGQAEIGNFNTIVPHEAHRTVNSLFGELSAPVLPRLTFSAAGRYDHYSDFGGTFNPKLGLDFKPVPWWTLRGNWSKSFQAPSLASTASAIPPAAVVVPASTFGGNPAFPNTSGTYILLLYPGGGVNLQPQKATTWELGTDIKPEAIPGLSMSVTYYNIDFRDRIGTPAFYSTSFYSLYPNSYIMNSGQLTSAQIASYIAPASNAATFANYVNNPASVYALENGLSQNLARTKTSGLDFNLGYKHATGFGSVFGGVAGTYILTFNSQATPTGSFQGLDANSISRLHLQTTLGATIGALSAQAVWRLTGKFAVQPTASDNQQSEVSSFSTINLDFQYAPKLTGALSNLSLNLHVDNLLNTNPPVSYGNTSSGYGYAGFTLGRFIELGIKKKF